MPTMATVKLCTSRPIVNHPHYEDVGLRLEVFTSFYDYFMKIVAYIYMYIYT